MDGINKALDPVLSDQLILGPFEVNREEQRVGVSSYYGGGSGKGDQAELIITSNCRYIMVEQPIGSRVNYVKEYLDGLTNAEIIALSNDTR